MVDNIANNSRVYEAVEVRSGPGRRRRWTAKQKGRIVAESFAPGAQVSEVARTHAITPQHLFLWRKAAKDGRLVLPLDEGAPFTPVLLEAPGRDGGLELGGGRRDDLRQRWDRYGAARRRGLRPEGLALIGVPPGVRVLVATKPVDFRKGADGLAAMAQEVFKQDPFSGVVLVFRAKRADRVRIVA